MRCVREIRPGESLISLICTGTAFQLADWSDVLGHPCLGGLPAIAPDSLVVGNELTLVPLASCGRYFGVVKITVCLHTTIDNDYICQIERSAHILVVVCLCDNINNVVLMMTASLTCG